MVNRRATALVQQQSSLIDSWQRSRLTGSKGAVLWLTGLSGSGKTTLAIDLEQKLIQKGILAYCIDGDDIRQKISGDLDFSASARRENIRRISYIARYLKEAHLIAIVSAIAPLASMRSDARKLIGSESFIEVYVQAGLECCMLRDPKKLYAKYDKGEIPFMTGLSSPYEIPENPEITLNTESWSIDECTKILYQQLQYLGVLSSSSGAPE